MGKKQHYVPRMYLKNFCIAGDAERCFEYNPHIKSVRRVRITEICEENYLYDIRDENGQFIFPDIKNKFEEVLSSVETKDEPFLYDLLSRIEKCDDVIFLNSEEREFLLGFAFLMVFRNPILRDSLEEAFDLIGGPKLNGKAETTYAWQIIMSRLNEFAPKENSAQITFLKTKKEYPFITSGMPMYFTGNPIQKDFYMPLSSTVAFEMRLPQNVLINLDRCEVKKLDSSEVDTYNGKMLCRVNSLISSSEELLKKYICFMDDFDDSPFNPFTLAHLEMLEGMDPWQFQIITIRFIEEELRNRNDIFCNAYNKLRKSGLSDKEVKNKMAECISDKFKRDIICNRSVDWNDYRDELERIK